MAFAVSPLPSLPSTLSHIGQWERGTTFELTDSARGITPHYVIYVYVCWISGYIEIIHLCNYDHASYAEPSGSLSLSLVVYGVNDDRKRLSFLCQYYSVTGARCNVQFSVLHRINSTDRALV